ncbi:molybdopterin molybdenumtransferase MoeA [Syntrophotalea acetylenivorans]|uniref:Molybdopterin molybdenumtransferase n=1 Tax=Syntrophotalea acetylenivorans TaxID=1842532 RepID=A0A1L3GKB4_9BACT|nr:gephyrin-like molybdotransferase Glp [Syntrophotalea acetylenivorans]APG26393.1 molybdopterin molybdenumtransferase MoeA [Syntrophotalea acetylenivorans]
MISIEHAQQLIMDRISPLEIENAPILQGLNRVTPENHISPWDIPLVASSAMDGYAFAGPGLSGDSMKVKGMLPAGQYCDEPILPEEAMKIMTGAPVPPSCDTVVPFEDVVVKGDRICLSKEVKRGANVRCPGENVCRDSVVIHRGSVLRPAEIGMLATIGKTTVPVFRRPKVAILSTGDELQDLGSTPLPGKIINSNSYSLATQVQDAGGEALLLGVSNDTQEATCEKMKEGLNADFLVISGGVSVGDRDYVKPAIEQLGGEILFWKVDMKPGKPVAFAEIQGIPIFALPGNPTAAMVAFELFVRPALLKAMGNRRVFRPKVIATIKEKLINKRERPHLVRGIVKLLGKGYEVSIAGNQGSDRIASLVEGNCLIQIESAGAFAPGDKVEVMLLDRGFEMGLVDHDFSCDGPKGSQVVRAKDSSLRFRMSS